MVIAIVILALLLTGCCFLLLTPITGKIDTYNNQYYIQVWGIAKCSLVWQEGILIVVRIPFYRFNIDPLAAKKGKKKPKAKPSKKEKKEQPGKTSFKWMKKMIRVLRSFSIKQLSLDLDTSSVTWNGYLYPVFYGLNRQNIHLRINYSGQSGLILHIENRLARMIWAFLR